MNYTEYLNSPIYWLRRAWLATDKAIDECFAAHILSSAQFEVLSQLWQEDGLSQRTLQERLNVSSATLTGVIDGLVERGFTERRISEQDARVKQLHLTEHGRSLEQEIGRQYSGLQDCLLTGMSGGERTVIAEWLKRMTGNIQDCQDRS